YSTADEVIEHAYEDAMQIIQLHTAVIEEDVSPEEVLADCFPAPPPSKYDIPDSQWEAFGRYCKKHPLKKGETILDRRMKFLKSLRKVKRKYYSKKRLSAMYDPLFAHTVVSEKEMIKNLEDITEKNAARIEEFHAFMESLCENNYISQDVMKKFDHQTKQMMDHHKRRLREFMKRAEYDDRTQAELDLISNDPIDEMFDLELT
ncbi:MAG: hypothetical protein K2F99_09720, partial [Muribaculaceae bacterium]|nr:hypothetical protein [Muribaculaceae bacterium]